MAEVNHVTTLTSLATSMIKFAEIVGENGLTEARNLALQKGKPAMPVASKIISRKCVD